VENFLCKNIYLEFMTINTYLGLLFSWYLYILYIGIPRGRWSKDGTSLVKKLAYTIGYDVIIIGH